MKVLIVASPNIRGRGGQIRSYYILKHLTKLLVDTYLIAIDTPRDVINELRRDNNINIISEQSCNKSHIDLCIVKIAHTINELINKLDIDIAVSHSEHPLFVLPIYFSSRNRVPWTVIVQSHMYINPLLRYGKYISVARFLRTKAALWAMNRTYVHLVSDAIQHELIKVSSGFRHYDVLDVPIGLEFDLIDHCLRSNQPKMYDLAFMGVLSTEKGIYDLLYIVYEVSRKYKPIKALLLGDFVSADHRDKFMSIVEKLGLKKSIILAGFKTGLDKYCELSRARLFIFPSYVDVYSISILEALSVGLPVITWDLPYARQFKNDAVIRVKNRSEFVNTLITLLKNQEHIERLSNEARRFTIKYTWSNAAYSEYKAFIKTISWWYRQ
ncbi:glycosyltransferase family 4 protein [Vulcanisaeta distributa]|uniref:glycosyltransferase family 4 protein n=1 Tax=Vulcanisaeta distributa TaxID=164451 RepID=UPI0006D09D0E|nr:glycosyltransferase family 4 protein [Vulcanisaeta distributa]